MTTLTEGQKNFIDKLQSSNRHERRKMQKVLKMGNVKIPSVNIPIVKPK